MTVDRRVGGVYYGYFFAQTSGGAVIKRLLLTGSPTATVLTRPINNIDIVNSHPNLVTDGVNLYWQDGSSMKKVSVGGGVITTLDPTTPNTPTAGAALIWTQCGSTSCQRRFEWPVVQRDLCHRQECPRGRGDVVRHRLLGRRSGHSPAVLMIERRTSRVGGHLSPDECGLRKKNESQNSPCAPTVDHPFTGE